MLKPSLVKVKSKSLGNEIVVLSLIVILKHQSTARPPVENIMVSFYAKGISVAAIEEELQEIDVCKLSIPAISIITDEVNQAVLDCQNRPLEPVFLIVKSDNQAK